MKTAIAVIVLALLSTVGASAQNASKRIALTPKSNIATAPLVEEFGKKCPDITITLDGTRADYLLEAVSFNGSALDGTRRGKADFTLFSASGDVLFQTHTYNFNNAVKDVCNFIRTGKK